MGVVEVSFAIAYILCGYKNNTGFKVQIPYFTNGIIGFIFEPVKFKYGNNVCNKVQ
jgi:hypothetical protein